LSFAYYTGFRPGDIIGLKWEHINFRTKIITKIIEKIAHKHPEPMSFPIPDKLIEILLEWRKQNGIPLKGWVFPNNSTGKRMGRKAMNDPWKKIRKLAKLPGELELYTLRHNFASHLIMNNIDLLTVSKLMGHADIKTTIDNYGHLRPDANFEASNVFAQIA